MARIRKILFPTRFDELAFACLQGLFPLRAAGLEEIVLLFVVDRQEVAFIPYGGFDHKLAEEMSEAARLRFADWTKEIEAAGFRSKSMVATGRPATKILDAAAEEEVDLIVTGRERHVAMDAVYLGGTAMEILRRSAVPVLVQKHGPGEETTCAVADPYERILYPTDFSPDAGSALEFLKVLGPASAHVDAVHVIPEHDLNKLGPEALKLEEERRAERLSVVCRELEKAGPKARAHVRAGAVDEEILGAARDVRATAIVMATTEKEGLREFWFGSVSHRVAELASIPVILVPVRPRK